MAKPPDPKSPAAQAQEGAARMDPALLDALIGKHVERRDAMLQREIGQLRTFMEQYAGATTLQCVIENGIADVVDKLGELTGKPKDPSEAQVEVLNRIERELTRPPDTDLFSPIDDRSFYQRRESQ